MFAGCSVLRGSGAAVVYATGRRTEFGKIAALSVEVRRPPTPLEREVTRMVRILTVVAVVMGVLFFAYGVATGRPIWVNVVFMLGIIVANVPEGLLPTLTLALAMGGMRLAKKQVLVKSLNAVEALGSVEVICTDKTGTLTKNELAVTDVVDAENGEPLEEAALRALEVAAGTASEIHEQAGALTGDPLDVAAAQALRANPGRRSARPLGATSCGTSRSTCCGAARRGCSPTAVDSASRSRARGRSCVRTCLAQGRRSTRRRHGRARSPSRGSASSRWRRAPSPGGRGRRAPRPPSSALELHGFLCLSDPLRDEVPAAPSHAATGAGIRVISITGDHPDTARAIAERAGILPTRAPRRGAHRRGARGAARERDRRCGSRPA